MSNRTLLLAAALLAVAGCRQAPQVDEDGFPTVNRPVAPIVSDRFSTEDARDRLGEAEAVMALAGIEPGMRVADIGAGEGYYTVRLSPAVGPEGRVVAQDIQPTVRDALAQRVQREGLDNVAVRLGEPDDPKLPHASFDRIFLVHMYHEVTEPYQFLWNLRQGLKRDGLIVVVDADRPVKRHGMPPARLDCEFGALGLERVDMSQLEGGDAYFATFKIAAELPVPTAIEPCD
ncbi:class I SAM-dependent methyltransferase [Sphingomicrobium astaxanthinifaciens]|uniref:class I SAM-dependent methyltransferase n=1 Tax=Sphingomicrobium astaxanthinifaciens TaxID=1227949 RepID=UPI001FCB3B9C|nr:methyltransferase domain-containing protein [Sphingomicrobium astaxanthinifaciens]MCJ7421763.1 protein-L-isoaspartate O-methyltransferase [Sphingomicrobium astaxanthinifaciens]